VSPDEFRLKTGLLGFTARDLDSIFIELDGRARQVLNGHGQVPEHVGEVVSAWWEETTTAVANTVAEATAAWETEQAPAQLTRYAQHALLPKEIGAHASSIQAWDYHLGLILRALDAAGIPHHITTIGQ